MASDWPGYIHRILNRNRSYFLVLALAGGAACSARNYSGAGPRYAGGFSPVRHHAARAAPGTLRIVTFNIKYAVHVDRAIALLRATPELHNADILALQEMDDSGTRRIAVALGMRYVYWPATVHRQSQRDFGNAILSRWPISDDRKVILPHLGRFAGTQRIAVGATVWAGGLPVRVYSVHFGTALETPPRRKRDQARAVLTDAQGYDRVIVAGDMNSHGVGSVFENAGYRWPTRDNPATVHWFNWDHVFLRGLVAQDSVQSGVVRDARGASDHRPVWTAIALRRVD